MITLLGDLWLDLPISYPYPEDSRASQELILQPLQSSWRWIFPRWNKRATICRLRAMQEKPPEIVLSWGYRLKFWMKLDGWRVLFAKDQLFVGPSVFSWLGLENCAVWPRQFWDPWKGGPKYISTSWKIEDTTYKTYQNHTCTLVSYLMIQCCEFWRKYAFKLGCLLLGLFQEVHMLWGLQIGPP